MSALGDRLARAWEEFWYRPEPARNLAVARALLAGTALWMVLSRFDLPQMLELPPELWQRVTFERRLRFFLVLPVGVERLLYVALHASLLAALLGVRTRAACLVSGVLLYHFAPLETIIRSPNPYLRGFTLPTLGLLVLAFSRGGQAPTSWEHRWPLRLVQVFFCQIYLFAAYAKLVTTGWSWVSAENFRGYLLVLNQALVPTPGASLGYALADHPALCGILAWAGFLFEAAFPLVLFVPRSRFVLLPLAVAFHVGNAVLFRIPFQNTPLLLLFLDWDRLLPKRPAA